MFVKTIKAYGKVAVFLLLVMLISPMEASGALFGGSRRRSKNATLKVDNNNEALVKLFNLDDKKNGSSEDPLTFAQKHYELGATRLQTACRAISSFYNEPVARDILQKIFTIDTQYFKEDIKNAATVIKKIGQLNFSINTSLQELSQVITAPGNNTLDTLDKVVEKTKNINSNLIHLTKKHIRASEKSIMIARAGYETFELIPSLSMAPVDMFVQSSKLLMSNTQSNAEAFKGLLLNVLSGTEQISLGLDAITKNVRETLRFSDHFAIKQFPLVNLPTPSREKIFVQLNSMANFVKGSESTINIAESQVRNQAQQFSHLIGNFVDKSAESLKYNRATSMPLEQISTYARNQINGLYLRVKEDVLALRREMAMQNTISASAPSIALETKEDYAVRRTKSLNTNKLPLFLLGGGDGAEARNTQPNPIPNVQVEAGIGGGQAEQQFEADQDFSEFIRLTPNKTTGGSANSEVFSAISIADKFETDFFEKEDFVFDDGTFGKSEMSILSEELGSNFFFNENDTEDGKDLIISTSEDMPDFGADIYRERTEDSQAKSISLFESVVDPELELLDF